MASFTVVSNLLHNVPSDNASAINPLDMNVTVMALVLVNEIKFYMINALLTYRFPAIVTLYLFHRNISYTIPSS